MKKMKKLRYQVIIKKKYFRQPVESFPILLELESNLEEGVVFLTILKIIFRQW